MVLTHADCTSEHKAQVERVLNEKGKAAIHRAIQVDGREEDVKFLADGMTLDPSTTFELCKDQTVREYIVSQKIAVHPCQALKKLYKGECRDYNYFLSGPGEDKQMESLGEST